MIVRYVTIKRAREFVAIHHRHHGAPVGAIYCLGLFDDWRLRGVCIVGRPVARALDDGETVEVTRLCTDGVKNGCSMLYSRARRVAAAYGFTWVQTYLLADENGASVKASGFERIGMTKGGSWSCPSRPRVDKAPTGPKSRWRARAG